MSRTTALLQEADESMQSGDWDRAIETLQALKGEEDRPTSVYSKLAQAFAVRGRYLTVLSIYLEWATEALEQNLLDQAERALEYALALNPESLEAHDLDIRLARARGDEKVLSAKLQELAFLLLEKGDGERPVALLREAAGLEPDDRSLPLRIAEMQVSLGQIDAAVSSFKECVERFQAAGEPDRKVEALQRLTMLRPDRVETSLELAQAYLECGRLEEAEVQFRAVLKLDLDSTEALLSLAETCRLQGKFRNGMLALNRLLQLHPESAEGHCRMGELHAGMGDLEKAKPAFEKAARIFLDEGRTDQAIEAYRGLLKMDPSDSSATNGLLGLGVEPTVPREDCVSVPERPAEEPQLSDVETLDEPEPVESEAAPAIDRTRFVRPAMVRKSEFTHKVGSARACKKKRMPGTASGPLRPGLTPKTTTARSKAKPVYPAPEPLVEEEVMPSQEPVAAKSEPSPEMVEPVEPKDSVEQGSLAEPEEDKGPQAELDIPGFEEVFRDVREEGGGRPEDAESAQVDPPESKEMETQVPQLEEPEDEFDFEKVFQDDLEGELFPSEMGPDLFEDFEKIGAITVAIAETEQSDQEPVEEVADSLGRASEVTKEQPGTVDDLFPVEPLPLDTLFPTDDELDSDWTEVLGLGVEELFPESEEPNPLTTSPEELIEEEPEVVETAGAETLTEEPSEACRQEEEILSIFEWSELDFESIEFDIPDPDETPSLSFEDIRAEEVSKLEDGALSEPAQSDELSRILDTTLPDAAPLSPEAEGRDSNEIPQGEELIVEWGPAEDLEPSELPSPAAVELFPQEDMDVGATLEGFRHDLILAPTDEEKTLRAADLCLRHGLLDEALKHYQALKRLNPGSSEFALRVVKTALWMEDYDLVKSELWELASLQFQRGELESCQDRLGELLSLQPDHKNARQLMVEIFLVSGKDKLASWHLSQMVENWLKEGEDEHALGALEKLAKLSPGYAVQERLAALHQRRGNHEEALQLYRELCLRYQEEEDWERAAAAGEHAVELGDSTAEDRRALVEIYQRLGRTEDSVDQKLLLAQDYRGVGDYGKAIQLLRDLEREGQSSPRTERLLIELYLQVGDVSVAEQHAENLAERFLEQKSYAAGVELFESWVGQAPTSARVRERLAQFYQLSGDQEGAKMEWLLVTETHQSQGDFPRAARALERALELEPDNWDWRYRLARLKSDRLGRPEDALEDMRALFRARPEQKRFVSSFLEMLTSAGLMAEVGRVLNEVADYDFGEEMKEETLRKCRQALAEQPHNHTLHFGWGELCYGLGSLDLAIEQFQKLRRLPELRFHSYRLLGLCFAEKKGLNMTNLALNQFSKALAMEAEVSTEDRLLLRYNMAEVLEREGSLQAALEQWKACQAIRPDYRDVARRIESLH